jgi:hypothetical protein
MEPQMDEQSCCALVPNEEKLEMLDRLQKLGLGRCLVVVHDIAQHRVMFDKFCQLGGEKAPRLTDALHYTRFNKIIVYFADIRLYAIVDDTVTRGDLRTLIGDELLCGLECIAENAPETTMYSVSLMLLSNTGQRLIFISSDGSLAMLNRFMSIVNCAEAEYLERKQRFNDNLCMFTYRNR